VTLGHRAGIRTVFRSFILFLCGGAYIVSASDLAQDVHALRELQPWVVSDVAGDAAPDQRCGIKNLRSYGLLRLELQLPPELSDHDADARISKIDRTVTRVLASRGWSAMKVSAKAGGIPDLSRCSHKQTAVAQIYKTTGRCTMNSPCRAYDGFAVMLYLPDRGRIE
jgi:hypothetical protein